MQHARNRPVVDRFVRVYRLGVVLLHHVVNVGELVQAVSHVRFAARGRSRIDLLSEYHSQKAAGDQYENHQEESAMRTTSHLHFPSVGTFRMRRTPRLSAV